MAMIGLWCLTLTLTGCFMGIVTCQLIDPYAEQTMPWCEIVANSLNRIDIKNINTHLSRGMILRYYSVACNK